MKKLSLLLAPLSLVADPCCMPLQDPNCYTYAVNPPLVSEPCCVWGGHFDFLYWKPHAEANPFAIILTVPSSNTGGNDGLDPTIGNDELDPTIGNGGQDLTFKDYDYDYRAAFRAGVDVGLPGNEWRAAFSWTHFLHDIKGSMGVSGGFMMTQSIIQSPYLNSSDIVGTSLADSSLNSQYRIQLDYLDLVLNREFYVGHQVTLRPYGGLRALFLKQRIDTQNEIFAGRPSVTASINAKLSTDFKGVGLVAGIFSSWDFLCDLGFYSDFSTSLLYGKNKSRLSGIVTNLDLDTPPITSSLYTFTYDPNVIRAVLDLAFGFQWTHFFFEDKGLFQLRAGWEQHQYLSQVNFATISIGEAVLSQNTNQTNKDLSFQGLVISGSFTY